MNLFRKPILPIEWELLNHDDKNYSSEEEPDVEEVCVKMVNLKKKLFSKVENNIRKAQARYKKDYDKKHLCKKV